MVALSVLSSGGSWQALATVLLFGVLMLIYVRMERPVLSRAMRGFLVACVLALVLAAALHAEDVLIARPTFCDRFTASDWEYWLLGCWGPYV